VMIDNGADCARKPTRALLLSELTTFLTQIETHGGKPAIVAPSAAANADYAIAEAVDRRLWINSNRAEPDDMAARWAIWQANDGFRSDGTKGPLRWLVARDGALLEGSSER
jgi:lysozyme